MLNKDKIMILCKVVDNYGDIGVVYRLARALSDLKPSLELSLVVSNLSSFKKMAPEIDDGKAIQFFDYKNSSWKIIDWNIKASSLDEDLKNPPDIILECFQCGRPDWLEAILFAEDFHRLVQIINIDYLTAEEYADEFHLLKSGTRKSNIKKIFFMPGFTKKTGGLIINQQTGSAQLPSPCGKMKVFFFAYEDECPQIVQGLKDFQEKIRESDANFAIKVFLADGKSREPFKRSWEKHGSPFEIEDLPFMQQEDFDLFITRMDFLFVRGEDSLARAALSGLPFVWQAYKQEENYQLVKVNALLDRMKDYFSEEDFSPLKEFWNSYNDSEKETDSKSLTRMLLSCMEGRGKGREGFKAFSQSLLENGNLAEKLLAFIDRISSDK
ncbi:MAG: elongation factor P maturation arginine rhamnosyltransferase EarP [Treponema sp.]|nr:elongation factor P maturation arginine rhamnosyltransferase EarP [Treponema sp.]